MLVRDMLGGWAAVEDEERLIVEEDGPGDSLLVVVEVVD